MSDGFPTPAVYWGAVIVQGVLVVVVDMLDFPGFQLAGRAVLARVRLQRGHHSATRCRGRIHLDHRNPGCSSLPLLDPGLISAIPPGSRIRHSIAVKDWRMMNAGFLYPERIQAGSYGVRWQSEERTATPLWILPVPPDRRRTDEPLIQSGVALRFPPQSIANPAGIKNPASP